MSVDNPQTVEELLDYIERYSATILVREFKNGVIGNWALAELPAATALHHAFRWIRQEIVPARRVSVGEQIGNLAAEAPLGEAPPPKETE